MSRIANQSLALAAALFLTLSSIGTIVSVPPAQAMSPVIAAELA
ncbi:hypothetical protein ACI5KX_03135 [Erythrobacter sp. GH1-10]